MSDDEEEIGIDRTPSPEGRKYLENIQKSERFDVKSLTHFVEISLVEAEEAQDLRMVRVTVSDLIDMCSPGPHVVTSEMLQAAVKKTTSDPQVVAADEEKQEDDTKISGSDIKVKSRRKNHC